MVAITLDDLKEELAELKEEQSRLESVEYTLSQGSLYLQNQAELQKVLGKIEMVRHLIGLIKIREKYVGT